MASTLEILVAFGILVAALSALGLAMWVIYRIGMWIAFNMYGERLGLTDAPADE